MLGIPAIISHTLKSEKFPIYTQQISGILIESKDLKIKTYPNFSLKIMANNITIKQNDSIIFNAENIDAKIFIPSLFLKKVIIYNSKAQTLKINIKRKIDNKYYIGKFVINVDILKNIIQKILKTNVNELSINLKDEIINKDYVLTIKDINLTYNKHKLLKLNANSQLFTSNNKPTIIETDLNINDEWKN